MGHVQGIVQNWGKVTAADIPPIMRVPPPALSTRVLKLSVKASLFGLAVWVVFRIVPLPKFLPNSIDMIFLVSEVLVKEDFKTNRTRLVSEIIL